MHLQAEVHCYHCGEVAGVWAWPAALPPTWGQFHGRGSAGWGRVALHEIRCPRCGGPVFLDEAAPVLPRPPLAVPPARRGRPQRRVRELAS
jgi:DNA-directed RNA polymerase subunit RPC12/RpoP